MSKVAPLVLFSFFAAEAEAGEKPNPKALRRPPRVNLRRTPQLARVHRAEPACDGMDRLPSRVGRPFKIGEELAYEISVAGAYVGRLEIKIGTPRKVQGKMVIPLFGRARTSSFVSGFQPLEGRYMSLVDPDTLAPVGVRVEGEYGGDPRWERIRFMDRRNVSADFLLKGQEINRTYRGSHDLTDILTMLYAARTVELSKGLTGCQDVFGARRLWRMDALVDDLVDVDTVAGKKRAFRVRTTFDRRPTPGLSSTQRPKFEIDVFLAEDQTQAPLAFVMRQEGITAEAKLVRWSLNGSSQESWEF